MYPLKLAGELKRKETSLKWLKLEMVIVPWMLNETVHTVVIPPINLFALPKSTVRYFHHPGHKAH